MNGLTKEELWCKKERGIFLCVKFFCLKNIVISLKKVITFNRVHDPYFSPKVKVHCHIATTKKKSNILRMKGTFRQFLGEGHVPPLRSLRTKAIIYLFFFFIYLFHFYSQST